MQHSSIPMWKEQQMLEQKHFLKCNIITCFEKLAYCTKFICQLVQLRHPPHSEYLLLVLNDIFVGQRKIKMWKKIQTLSWLSGSGTNLFNLPWLLVISSSTCISIMVISTTYVRQPCNKAFLTKYLWYSIFATLSLRFSSMKG